MTAHHTFPQSADLPLDVAMIDSITARFPEARATLCSLLDIVTETRGTTFSADRLDEMVEAFLSDATEFAELCQEHIHEAERRNAYDGRDA